MSNFTPRAQQVLALARKEADRFHHNFVGTEHLLLGLIALGQGTAVTVLQKSGIELENAREEVEKQVGAGPDQKVMGNIPFTPRVKKVLAFAQREAKELHHTYVGTEHILLGILREGDGVAARVLKQLGTDLDQIRQAILKELDPNATFLATDSVPSETPRNPPRPKPCPNSVDTEKHYDVYCVERNQQAVLYRNVLFKGRSGLFRRGEHDYDCEYLQLELPNGQTVYVALFSVIKFCEHGTEIAGDAIPPAADKQ